MTTLPAWAHLPNASHIDRILAHAKAHPERWNATRDATRDATRGATRGAARDAIAALVAWNECSYLLDWPEDQVRAHYALTQDPAALLLLPAVLALNLTGEKA